MDIKKTKGLNYAYILDGNGSGKPLENIESVEAWKPEDGVLWAHFDLNERKTHEWLTDEFLIEALVDEEEPRPRCLQIGDGLVVIFRAMNHNPGAEVDDMLVLRIWAEKGRVITFSNSKLLAIKYIQRKIVSGIGPTDSVSMLEELAECIMDRMSEAVSDIDEFLEKIEDSMIADEENDDMMGQVSEVRRQLSTIKRYVYPQREAMENIPRKLVTWMDKADRSQLRESAHRLTRILEDIENLRERASINIDELNASMNQDAQRNMYMISVLAAFFLPLTFITGLLGINVGGIPFSGHDYGFTAVCVIIAALSIILITIFKKLKWL